MDASNEQQIAQLQQAAREWLIDAIDVEKLSMLSEALHHKSPRSVWVSGTRLKNVLDSVISRHDHRLRLQVIANLACIAPVSVEQQTVAYQLGDALRDATETFYKYAIRSEMPFPRTTVVDLLCAEVLPVTDELRLRLGMKSNTSVTRFRQPNIIWSTDVESMRIIAQFSEATDTPIREYNLILNRLTGYIDRRNMLFSKPLLDGKDKKTEDLIKLQQIICEKQAEKIQAERAEAQCAAVRSDNVVHVAFGRPSAARPI